MTEFQLNFEFEGRNCWGGTGPAAIPYKIWIFRRVWNSKLKRGVGWEHHYYMYTCVNTIVHYVGLDPSVHPSIIHQPYRRRFLERGKPSGWSSCDCRVHCHAAALASGEPWSSLRALHGTRVRHTKHTVVTSVHTTSHWIWTGFPARNLLITVHIHFKESEFVLLLITYWRGFWSTTQEAYELFPLRMVHHLYSYHFLLEWHEALYSWNLKFDHRDSFWH